MSAHYALLALAALNITLALVNVRNARRNLRNAEANERNGEANVRNAEANVRNAEANLKASERLAAPTTIHVKMAEVDGALIMRSLRRHRRDQGRGPLS